MGLDKAKGDIFLCIDSDDILKENILKTISSDFKGITRKKEIAGVMYVQGYISNNKKIIGSYFPNDDMIDTYYNVYHKYKVTGDKLIVLKTSVAKEYYFPIFEGEKFVPEALIFNRISQKYSFLCRNIVTSYKEYLVDGYSNNYFNLVKRNPIGNTLYFKEAYEFNKSFYNVYGYLLFGIYSHRKFISLLKEHPAKFKIMILYLLTLLVSKLK